jgi:hypothetical protein
MRLKMLNVRQATSVVVLSAVVIAGAAVPAGAATRVGPKQYFTGVVNGIDGNTANPITINMVCGGPASSGHPAAGQTLAVHELFPPSPTGSLGYTGNDKKIGVFFKAPPAARSRARKSSSTPTFVRYDKPVALPTSLTLPCSGTGTVWFAPIAVVPPSRSASVPVQFVSPGVTGAATTVRKTS